jgi:hypothetical protein
MSARFTALMQPTGIDYLRLTTLMQPTGIGR